MKVALCALLFLGVLGTTLALECYSCSYTNLVSETGDKNCADPFKATGISKSTCSGKCYKTITKNNGETTSVNRACSALCVAADCTSVLGIEVCATCCEGDLCNGAGPVTFSLVAMVAMVASAWAFSQ
ncbi:ly-6/neurotoxin-like protein 1 isoform X2 [Patiria miniata]|nr:ly-6/neurotoxin-like protein 1 isoform X2 [Patiria miniata]